jgi:mycofactocin glycosyltransferase
MTSSIAPPTAPAPAGVDAPLPPEFRVALDRSTRRLDDGTVIQGGSPLRILRLTKAGARLIDTFAAGASVPEGVGPQRLVRRLLDTGMVQPRPGPARCMASDVTVVIPVRDDTEGLSRLLSDPDVFAGVARIIVVDDGSLDGRAVRQVCDRASLNHDAKVDLIWRPYSAGPGRARTAGIDACDTTLIAFVDADCLPAAGWLEPLLQHFEDPAVGAVGPRIRVGRRTGAEVGEGDGNVGGLGEHASEAEHGAVAAHDNSAERDRLTRRTLARITNLAAAAKRAGIAKLAGDRDISDLLFDYEDYRSPLDQGPDEGRVGVGGRIPYIPTASLVVRRDAVERVGGFDAVLQVGEDVDLVWRLTEAGWTVRYEPAVEVKHDARTDMDAWMLQRVRYGTSAGPLALRHRGALAPVRVSFWSAVSWGLVGAGRPASGVAVAGTTTALLARRLDSLQRPLAESVRIAGRGHVLAGRVIADAMRRVWWPLLLVASLVFRRARRVSVVVAILPPLIEWAQQRPRIDPVRWCILRLADDVSYGAGVWRGCVRWRTIAPLVPDLTNWPGRARAVEDSEG